MSSISYLSSLEYWQAAYDLALAAGGRYSTAAVTAKQQVDWFMEAYSRALALEALRAGVVDTTTTYTNPVPRAETIIRPDPEPDAGACIMSPCACERCSGGDGGTITATGSAARELAAGVNDACPWWMLLVAAFIGYGLAFKRKGSQ